MGSAVGGTNEVLFGKSKSRGMQPMLQRITIYSSVVFMISVLIMGLVLRAAS
jgi:protein translocase SecG subunit